MKTLILASAITRAGKKLINEILEDYNISYIDYHLLYFLEKNPGETQYNILKSTLQTKSRINQLIRKLENLGYLEKKAVLVGALLKKPLYLTESGKEIVSKGRDIIYSHTLEKLTKEERESYKKYNEKMVEILINMRGSLGVKIPEFYKI
uniref:MarR family transcriptional regulator n=1 Tax=Hirondellea gigas TaxID=1518452 RepID=A0A6A7GEW5_9CRUS